MVATFESAKQAVVPPELSREQVIAHLQQKYETIIRMQPVVERFMKIHPEQLDHCLADPFFNQDKEGTDITTYEIFERVPILPFLGISQLIQFPVYFQDFAEGVRAKVVAPAGTVLRTTYTVRPLEGNRAGKVMRRGGWQLIEEAHVECNVLLKPFIAKSFHDAHENMCQRILADLRSEIQNKDLGKL